MDVPFPSFPEGFLCGVHREFRGRLRFLYLQEVLLEGLVILQTFLHVLCL